MKRYAPLLLIVAVILTAISSDADILINGVNVEECNCRYGYYVPVGIEPFDSNRLVARITFTDTTWKNISIDHDTIVADTLYDFGDVGGNRQYWIMADSADTVVGRSLRFTAFPVVHLYLDTFPLHSGGDYVPGWLSITEPGKTSERMDIKIKYRGGSTNTYKRSKRNFKVKFVERNDSDTIAVKIDRKLLDLRSDNSWVLDAMQIDLARMRNYVACNIWADMQPRPYYADAEPKARLYPRGRLVEMLFGDDLRGIYGLYEPVDRKQLKLRKYDEDTHLVHGQLYKGSLATATTYMSAPVQPDSLNEQWDGFEIKYPDIEDICPVDYGTLYQAALFVANSTDLDFAMQVGDYFDLPILIDYYVFVNTVYGVDNSAKNIYWACYDKEADRKLTLAVWDLDCTVGQQTINTGSFYHSISPLQDIRNDGTFLSWRLLRRLVDLNVDSFSQRARQRYDDLRRTVLHTDSLLARYNEVFDLYRISGAGIRESRRWTTARELDGHTLDFDAEQAYISQWLRAHLQHLDRYAFGVQLNHCDANGDGTLDASDINEVVNIILDYSPYNARSDADHNNVIDLTDLDMLLNAIKEHSY